MSSSTLTPNLLQTISTQFPSLSHHQTPSTSRILFNRKSKHPISSKSPSILTPFAALSDPFVLQIAETFEDSLSSSSSSAPLPLQKLRDSSSESLLSLSWPTRKDEPYRFTDTSFIKSSEIQPITNPPQDSDISSVSEDTHLPNLTIIDGYLVETLSGLSGLPEGVYVGSLSKLSSEGILKRVSEFVSNVEGDLFWSLNGVGAPDLIVVYVPEGCRVDAPLNLRYCSVKGSDVGSNTLPVSNPRVLVLVEKGGEVGIVEEFVGGNGNKCYWTNSVLEVIIGEGATFSHSYVQTQSLGAAHIKWTSIRQYHFGIKCIAIMLCNCLCFCSC
uniref:Uncharacterized protein n=1 Tax=Chenopodium quinoa TaxID=63459 RepID=A0A803LU57_CHEQI